MVQKKYELTDGERRLRACKIAGVMYKATVRTDSMGSENEELLLSAAANFNREEHTPWEEIDLVRRLMEKDKSTGRKFSAAAISRSLGKDPTGTWVSTRKIIHDRMTPEVLEMMRINSSIPLAIAKQIADLRHDEQIGAMRDYLNGDLKMSKIKTRAASQRQLDGRSRKRKPSDTWKTMKNGLGTIEEKVSALVDKIPDDAVNGDFRDFVFDQGATLANRLDFVAEQLKSRAKALRSVREAEPMFK